MPKKIADFIDDLVNSDDLSRKFLNDPEQTMKDAGLSDDQRQKVHANNLPDILNIVWDEDLQRTKQLKFRPVR